MAWTWLQPTVGGADICPRWSGSIESAAELPRQHGIVIVDERRDGESAARLFDDAG
jgi:hypothetical protein